MKMDHDVIKAQMRLLAIEYVLSDLCAKFYTLIKAPKSEVEAAQKRFREHLRMQTFGVDPAQSDLLAAEFEDAVTKLLTMQLEMLEHLQK